MSYAKRGSAIAIFVFLLSVYTVSAAHTAALNAATVSVYETKTANMTFTISNDLFSTSSINYVGVDTAGFQILSAFNLTGWTDTVSNGTITYTTNTSGISNWGSQNFGVEARAPQVPQNESFNWSVTTMDYAGGSYVNSFIVQIIHDDTPPAVSNILPQNGSFVKNTTNIFSINAVDPETDVQSVSLQYAECSANTTNEISLNNTNGTYSANVNLAVYPDSSSVCYQFNATNYAGESALYGGAVTVDGVPPKVGLVSPNNNFISNNVSMNFTFNATDNLAPVLNCSLNVNNQAVGYAQAQNGAETTIQYTIPADGIYKWNVTCADLAGWLTTSATRNFSIDLYGPNITLAPVGVVYRGSAANFNANISDFSGVSSVSGTVTDPNGNNQTINFTNSGSAYSASYPTSINSTLGNYTLTIDAFDGVGNPSSKTVQFEVAYKYNVTLSVSSPVNTNGKVSVSGSVIFDNGSMISENETVLTLPGGNVSVPINASNGDFSYTFNAPSTGGNYQITASVTSLANGLTYSATKTLTVNQPAAPRPSGGGGGGSSGGGGSGTPISYSYSSSGLVYKECSKDSDCGQGKQCNDGRCVSQQQETFTNVQQNTNPNGGGNSGILNVTPISGSNSGVVENTPEVPAVGQASGFLNIGSLNLINLLWVVIAILAILSLFGLLGRKGRKRNDFGLDGYLERRRSF